MTLKMKTDLKPWQVRAVAKLQPLKVGALYMDMGTGKTRTALELIHRRLDAGKIDSAIWLCPYSIQKNIISDFDKHTSGWEDVIQICGIETLSTSVKKISELYEFAAAHKTMLIVDESSLIKNHNAKRSKNIELIAQKCKYKIILNGTPISKNEQDLYMQWHILDWRILGYRSFWSFSANHLEYDEYGKLRRCLHVDTLTDKIAPYTYQVKRDECMELPGKVYHFAGYYLGDEESEYYESVLSEYLDAVDEWDSSTLYKLFSALQSVISGKIVQTNPYETMVTIPRYSTAIENPRILKFLDVVKTLGEEKCIVYCKYTDEILQITELLNASGYTAAAYFGDLNKKARENALEQFSGDTQFLIANKGCAAFGLNLQFCHNIIFYSNDWNYATRIQAEDRIHRLGQTHACHIWDIYAYDTLDERISKSLTTKEAALSNFVQSVKGKQDAKGKILEFLSCRKSSRS